MVESVRRPRILSSGNGTSTTTTSDCRCSEDGAGEAFASLLSSGDRSCQTQEGEDGIIPTSSKVGCVPLTYGRGCTTHDAFYDGGSRQWCYVKSREGCMSDEDQRIYASYFFESAEETLYYSYTACGEEDWTDRLEREKTLGGATILAATPQAYFPPYHYKRGPDGEVLSVAGDEYWNASVPYEGVMIDYLRELQELSGGDFEVEWTHGSRASRRVHPSSAYTASVQDIADGTVDLAVGPIWVTADRLRLAQVGTGVDVELPSNSLTFECSVHHDCRLLEDGAYHPPPGGQHVPLATGLEGPRAVRAGRLAHDGARHTHHGDTVGLVLS